jgi:hypothetical protein
MTPLSWSEKVRKFISIVKKHLEKDSPHIHAVQELFSYDPHFPTDYKYFIGSNYVFSFYPTKNHTIKIATENPTTANKNEIFEIDPQTYSPECLENIRKFFHKVYCNRLVKIIAEDTKKHRKIESHLLLLS